MGREYWHWGGGGRSSSSTTKSSSNGSRKKQGDQKVGRGGRRRRGEVILMEEEEEEVEIRGSGGGGGGLPSGCMCAVFQIFENFQLVSSSSTTPFKPAASFLVEDRQFNIPKGTEAPRNSLEIEEPPFPLSTGKENKNYNLDIPMGIQIKTRSTTTTPSMGDHKRSTSKALKGGQPSSETLLTNISNADSPSTKTPTLVARLMGLDLLPDPTSSPSSCPRPHRHCRPNLLRPSPQHVRVPMKSNRSHDDPSGTRSLPETPRVSASSSCRRSDVDHHHRLSLQINKENVAPGGEEAGGGLSRILTRRDQNLVDGGGRCTSPGNYARQIVKQVKESVSRRVGLDITNNIVSGNRKAAGSKTGSRNGDVGDHHHQAPRVSLSNDDEVRVSACRPRKSQEDNKKNGDPNDNIGFKKVWDAKPGGGASTVTGGNAAQRSKLSSSASSRRRVPVQRTTTDVVRNKQEEPFVRLPSTRSNVANNPDRKPKRMIIMPLSSNYMTPPSPNGLLPVKRYPTPPATKIPSKQAPNGPVPKWSSQLPKGSSQPYKFQDATSVYTVRMDNNNKNNARLNTGINNKFKLSNLISVVPLSVATTVVTENGTAEYDYIAQILNRAGVDKNSHVSFTRWFSPTHPLDPSIFYYLEHFTDIATAHPGQLGQRCNRKLLFQLVDEILVDILGPHRNSKPWASPSFKSGPCSDPAQTKGSDLVDLLCTKVRSFPSVDCRVLEDIDGLINADMRGPLVVGPREPGFEEEEDGLVGQVEREILDALVHEVAVVLCGGGPRRQGV